MNNDVAQAVQQILHLQAAIPTHPREEEDRKAVELIEYLGNEELNEHGVFTDPETLTHIPPKGLRLSGENCIQLSKSEKHPVYFFNISTAHSNGGSSGLPSARGIPYITREAALRAAVFAFRVRLEEQEWEENPKHKKLKASLLKWLDMLTPNESIEWWGCRKRTATGHGCYRDVVRDFGCAGCERAEAGRCDGPYLQSLDGEFAVQYPFENPISDSPESPQGDAQLRLGGREDGFVLAEDFEDEQYKQIKRDLEAVNANKKQVGKLQKAYNRQSLYLSIASVVDEARIKSRGCPAELWFAVDTLGKVEALNLEKGLELPEDIQEYMILYAAFQNGEPVDLNKIHDALKGGA